MEGVDWFVKLRNSSIRLRYVWFFFVVNVFVQKPVSCKIIFLRENIFWKKFFIDKKKMAKVISYNSFGEICQNCILNKKTQFV